MVPLGLKGITGSNGATGTNIEFLGPMATLCAIRIMGPIMPLGSIGPLVSMLIDTDYSLVLTEQ